MLEKKSNIITPNWPAPPNIHSASTTREGGISEGAYKSFNLSDQLGDSPEHVAADRQILKLELTLPSDPVWLKQVHGSKVLNLDNTPNPQVPLEFDATFTTQPNRVCAVMTADCLPLLLCDTNGIAIAAVHCGWRSIAAGIIGNVITLVRSKTDAPILAWMGPAIGPTAFEVGDDMRTQFEHKAAFKMISDHKYLADIYELAKFDCLKYGVLEKNIFQEKICTYSNPKRFYSFRRDNATGRMGTLIWKSSI